MDEKAQVENLSKLYSWPDMVCQINPNSLSLVKMIWTGLNSKTLEKNLFNFPYKKTGLADHSKINGRIVQK